MSVGKPHPLCLIRSLLFDNEFGSSGGFAANNINQINTLAEVLAVDLLLMAASIDVTKVLG